MKKVLFILLFSVAALGQSMGPLVQSTTNPNFFKRPDGKTIVLSGTHTWDTFQATGEDTAPETNEPFDFTAYVSMLQSRGHNVTILWRKDLPTYCNYGADGGATTWHMTMWPWNRNGASGATDGGLKFDLTVLSGGTAPTMAASSLNQAYFDRLSSRVQQLQTAGIYAIVELFDGLGLHDNRCGTSSPNGDGYPFTSGNNINSLSDGYTTGATGVGSMTMTSVSGITDVQEAYVKKVIDTLNAYPNVIWEISEEADGSSTWWQAMIIDLVHKYEGGGSFQPTGRGAAEVFTAKTYRHPVLYPMLGGTVVSDGTILNSNADAVAACGRGTGTNCNSNSANTPSIHLVSSSSPTYGTGATAGNKCGTGSPSCKVSITDSDHNYFGTMWTDTQQTVRNVIWENFTYGNSYVFMDPYILYWPTNSRNVCATHPNGVCSAPITTSNGWQENTRRNLGYIVTYGNSKLNLGNATPQPSLCQTGFCLAYNNATAAQFLVYFPAGGANWVNLSAQNGHTFRVEWFDPATGNTVAAADYTATSGTTTQTFTPPGTITTDAVLLLIENQWAGILDPTRATDWTGAGVVGGIPARTTICSTLNPGATAAQINSAIASCPSGQTVFLNAGTYSVGGITFGGVSNVTLRGAGADQTIINSTGTDSCQGQYASICIPSSNLSYYAPGPPTNVVNWTAGFAKGTTTITLSAVTGLSVGMYIILDGPDGGPNASDIVNCSVISTCTTESGGGSSANQRGARAQREMFQVAGISGNNVTLDHPIRYPNWVAVGSQAAWWGNASGMVSGNGVENLTLNGQNNGSVAANITLMFCANCWLKGVASLYAPAPRANVLLYQDYHVEIRDSYFYGTGNGGENSGPTHYGIEAFPAFDSLIINNIFQRRTSPVVLDGGVGNVIAYNFAINDIYLVSPTFLQGSYYSHEGGNAYVLWEGNIGPQFKPDVVHGASNMNTSFRGYYRGWEPSKTSETGPVKMYAFQRFYNLIGNVLGRTGYFSSYGGNSDTSIYTIGKAAPASDAYTATSLMRWGNYDSFNNAAQWNNAEVPSGLSSYANAVPGNQTLPASFFLGTTAPNWWGGRPWPAIGPDVTGGNVGQCAAGTMAASACTSNAQCPSSSCSASLGGTVTANPAMSCYLTTMNGTADGSAGPFTFNASTCYAASGVPATYFGMHTLDPTGHWPTVSIGAVRPANISWAAVETARGVYNWTTFDAWVTAAQSNGVEFDYLFLNTPSWAGSASTLPPTILQDWNDFVTAVVTRYAGRINSYEVWNEPNSTSYWTGTTAQLVDMANRAYTIIKAIDPAAKVLTPSPTWTATTAWAWMDTYLTAGGGAYADVIAYHAYTGNPPNGESVLTVINGMNGVLASHGFTGDSWITEAGWGLDSDLPNSSDQAAFLAQRYLLSWGQGARRFYWYQWDNTNWGTLWTSGGGVNQAGNAYQQVYNWMAGAAVSACTKDGASTYTCPMTRSNGYQARAVWNRVAATAVSYPSQFTQYRDLAGAVHPLVNGGTVTAGAVPILLETVTTNAVNNPVNSPSSLHVTAAQSSTWTPMSVITVVKH